MAVWYIPARVSGSDTCCLLSDASLSKICQVQGDTKKRELLKNPTKIEEIQGKKILTEIEPLQLAF